MALPPFRVKAIYDYVSPHDDDLGFSNGQVITVTEEEDADWYFGEYADSSGKKQSGLFPKNFVNLYEPETPPRPSRQSRSKRDLEVSPAVGQADEVAKKDELETLAPQAQPVTPQSEITRDIAQPRAPAPPVAAQTPNPPDLSRANPPVNISTKPVPPSTAKPAPPPVTEKPATGSFRDRINAFNKPAAPPVAPMKPSGLGSSGGSGFVKKPFVAPPPSKNAYVPPPREAPPQKLYRREEDPEVTAQSSNGLGIDVSSAPLPGTAPVDEEENQPKPTSLKDRIALLQKQQMEQAAKHAEASQKKERPKRAPQKKQVESHEETMEQVKSTEESALERINSAGTTGKRSIEAVPDDPQSEAHTTTKSRDATLVASPSIPGRDSQSDANDADQSGAGDTEGDELSTGREDSDEKHWSKAPAVQPHEPDVRDESDVDEDENEEEPEMDPEVKRRMEIRERMAKMSGGMGMAGMFGPAPGMQPMASKKQNSGSSERKIAGKPVTAPTDDMLTARAPPVPIMPMPGMQRVRSPEQEDTPIEVSKEEEDISRSIVQGRKPDEMPDVEDLNEDPVLPPRSIAERSAPPPVPQDRPVPAPPTQGRGAPPPVPIERPPPQHSDSRPVPRPPPSQPMSPSTGSESDDEMSIHTRSLSMQVPRGDDSYTQGREALPPIQSGGPPPSLPSRAQVPQSPTTEYNSRNPNMGSRELSPTSPVSTINTAKRSSRVPPIPGSSPNVPTTSQMREPPPPPPTGRPSNRISSGNGTLAPPVPIRRPQDDSDGEVTEYDGDYDTDMAPGANHKDALRSHERVSSLEDDSMNEETTLHHSGLPSIGPSPSAAPRSVPPPPPNQPPKNIRRSSDMPRAPPPPPPPHKEQTSEPQDDEYDPYRHTFATSCGPDNGQVDSPEGPTTPMLEDPDELYSASPPRRSMPPPPAAQNPAHYASPPSLSASGRAMPRQSLEVQRSNTNVRRSMDIPRPSGEQGFIAEDIDVGQNSQWWAQPKVPPPILQNRRDVVYEIEDVVTTQGSTQVVTKSVHVLYMDYSQTVITAQFEVRDKSNVSFEQRHEPPPGRLRQDQLENAHMRLGSRIAENAASKKETVVGDGTPHALVLELIASLPEALLPVGVRAYGAQVYANLANASVQQFDEIRSGDIVTFRSARFQGHRGPMHTKYSIEVGKPDHVAVVVDWDGTKKKVRAWEQGRESKKVKMESFKLGDMRSGEVKVWRVMARQWVGWDVRN